MIAKQRLIEFLRAARTQPDTPFTFTLDMQPHDAKVYIHRMRVELGRFRSALQERGERLRRFKMLVREVIPAAILSSRQPHQTRQRHLRSFRVGCNW